MCVCMCVCMCGGCECACEAVHLHDGPQPLLTLNSKKNGLSVCRYVEVVEVAIRRTNEKAAEIKQPLCTR